MGNILVSDDDPLNRRLLTATLEHQGHTTSSASDGATALAMLAEDPPDVVLLDLVMPGMDGIEVLERIKGDDALRHLPVIVISGVDDAESVVRCIEMGAEDFLPKPFDPVILRAGERGSEPQAAARPGAATRAERLRPIRAGVGRRRAARSHRGRIDHPGRVADRDRPPSVTSAASPLEAIADQLARVSEALAASRFHGGQA